MNRISNIVMTMIAATAIGAAGSLRAAERGVEIEHLGVNNTLVRVTADGKYLILPVQESNDEATVNVLVDGKTDKTLSVRLAKSKVDYTVPLKIEDYKGKAKVEIKAKLPEGTTIDQENCNSTTNLFPFCIDLTELNSS